MSGGMASTPTARKPACLAMDRPPEQACDGARGLSFRGYLLGAALILALATALRFHGLGDHSLWYDEAVYANNSTGDLATVFAKTRTVNTSPIVLPYLYYLLGDSVRDAYRIRILPAVFGVAAVAALLALPAAGVPALAALPAALWLALAPMQIHFSQEVREYSLASFVAALLLLVFSAHANHNTGRTMAACATVLFLTPLCSYGPVLLAAALVAALPLARVMNRGILRAGDIFVPVGAFAAGIAVSYVLTAQSQMSQLGFSRTRYLAPLYPPDDVVAAGTWLFKSLELYLRFATGSRILSVGSGIVIAAAIARLVVSAGRRHADADDGQIVCMLAAVFLVVISIAAAFRGAYPFGGARQHLFAAPPILTATCIGTLWLARAFRARPGIAVAVLSCLVVCLVAPQVRSAYGKAEDIRPVIDANLRGVDDASVYVYHKALPAMKFHYPHRRFTLAAPGSRAADGVVRDIVERMQGNDLWVVASHAADEEVRNVVAGLVAAGWRYEAAFGDTGAKLVHLRRGD